MKKVKKNMIKYCFYLLMKNKSTITIHLQHTLCVRIDAVQNHCAWKETDRDSGNNNVKNVKRPRAVEWNVNKSMNPMHKSCSCSNCKQGAIFYREAFTTKVVEMIIVCCAMDSKLAPSRSPMKCELTNIQFTKENFCTSFPWVAAVVAQKNSNKNNNNIQPIERTTCKWFWEFVQRLHNTNAWPFLAALGRFTSL